MKYLRRQNLNATNFLDDTVLQTAAGNIELNPTQKVTIRGDLDVIGGAIPGPVVTNVMYVTTDGDDNNDGMGEGPNQAKKTIKAALAVAQEGTTIYVRSGEYYEDNPLRIPPKVAIIGDNLRTTIVRPINGPTTYEITNIERTNNITTITTSAPHGLSTDDRVRVRCSNDSVDETDVNIFDVPAPDQIVYRQAGANIVSTPATGKVLYAPDLFLVNSGNFLNNMVFKGVAAPAYCIAIDSDAIVDTSPYVQNCSNINGPWLKNGDEWLPFQTEQPDINSTMVVGPRPLLDDEIDPLQVDVYGIDVEGGGGGMLIDGDRYNSQSPIKSMVADAFTQVAQGGVGFHITNFGYMQLVSCFSVFCSKGFYTSRGGYLSISNSVCDFGDVAFLADGYYLDPYNRGQTITDYYSSVGSITVNVEGSGYAAPPSIFIDPPTTPGGVQAQAVASIDPILGVINAITVTDPGSGYDFQPNITITPQLGAAAATANLAKNQFIEVFDLANRPQVGSVMLIGEIDPLTGYEIGYYVSQVTNEAFTFKYDEQKCRRDVGYILDAVLGDAVLGTNHAATYAGLSYLRSYSSKVTSLQKAQTIAGLQQARNQALTYTANATMQTAITNGFNNVINIIQIGLPAVPSITNNPTTPRRAGYYEAAQILLTNKTFIQDEIEAWISVNYPLLSYNVAACRRDIAYIIDALAYDLTYEGDTQTINAALAYAAGNVIAGQVEETQAAYEYWKTIVGSIVQNIAITPSTGNSTLQNVSQPLGSPLSPTGPATEAQNLLQIVIDVVDHGTGYIPDPRTEPEYANGDPILNIERNLVLDNTIAIQDYTIDYLNNSYGGSCKVYTFPAIQNVGAGTNIRFHNVSTVSTSSTALEYVGSGVTYNALPFFGGQPDPAKESISINNGKTFTVTSDQVGNYRIGSYFTVNALTGEVTIDAENINLSGIAAIGPFKRNGVPVGEQLREVSNNSNLIASTGFPDVNTVPTQQAVTTYVENRYLNKVSVGDTTVAGANITFNGDVGINGGDLYSTAATFNLLNRNDKNSISEDGPTTVNAFLAATTISIGANTGTSTVNNNLEVLGSIISTPQASVDLLNANATTINAFGDATTINIGDTTGTISIKNTTFELPNATLVDIGGTNLTVQNSVLGGTLTLFDTYISTLNAFRSATTINMGESTGTFTINSANTVLDGDLQVKGGDITTNQTTFNLINTTATTVNAFGAGTIISIGAGSGTTTVNNNLQVNLNSTLGVDETSANVFYGTLTANIRDNTTNSLNIKESTNSYLRMTTSNGNELTSFGTIAKVAFENTTDALSTSVASATFAGGVGIAKKLYVGTDLNVLGNAALGNDRTTDVHTVDGTLSINVPDNTAVAFQVKENTQTYLTADTTNGSESITVESTPKLLVKNATDNTLGTAASGSAQFTGGVGIAKNLTVGVDLGVVRDVVITGDLAVNGGDLTTTAATFNLINTNATTVNFAGAGTSIAIGAATGTTNIKHNLDVDGDVNIDGGDLTVSTSTFNLANTTATTLNIGGAGTAFNLGVGAGSATTVTMGSASNTGNTFKIGSTAAGTVNYTTDVVGGVVNAWQSVTGTINIGASGTLVLGTSTSATTTVQVGSAITGNTLKIASTAAGTANLTSDVTTGNVNAFTGSTGNVDLGGTGVTVNLGTTSGNSILEVRAGTGGTATVRTNAGVTAVDLFNTVATTGNLFGAGTTINIGAATGTTTINNANTVVTGDLAVNGGDITSSATTFNLLNSTVTTANLFGAGTAINIGAATGTTNIKNNLDVDGDVNIDGGDLTVSTAAFNLANTNASTINAFGAGVTISIGSASGTTTIKHNLDVDGDVQVKGGDITTNQTSFNLINTTATTVNAFGAATNLNIGAATGSTTIANDLVVNGDAQIKGGDLTVDASTATFNLVNTNATTINAFGTATAVNIGAATGTLTIGNPTITGTNATAFNLNGTSPSIATTSTGTVSVFNTNALTGNLFGAATNITIGAAGLSGTATIRNDNVVLNGDLQVKGGDLTTDQVTFNLLNTTATTVNAFGAATAVNIGAATGTTSVKNNLDVDGDVNIDGGDLTVSTATFNLINTTATTVNAFGAATSLVLSAATGTTNIRNNLDVDGDVNIDGGDLTVSTSTFNLANTTATTVNAFGAATSLILAAATGTTNIRNNLDVDGDVNIDGGDLTVSTGTFNLANTTATTVNAFGAATAINIGFASPTGLTNIKHDLKVDGDLQVDGTLALGSDVTITGDLAVNGGDLTTTASTFNLINANAATVNFAGAGTAITIGSTTGTTTIRNANTVVTGDLAINGGDITSSAVTFNLLAATTTTVNAFGAATALNLGAATGLTTVKNGLEVDLDATINGSLTVDINATVTGDLAVNGGDLTTSAATFNLINANATTVNFAGAATSIEIGSATGTTNINNNLDVDGDVNIDGGDLTVSTGTFNLANTTATTINFAGAATSIEIGSATGTTNINNNLDVDGDVNIDGGDLTASGTTFNLLNTNITTGNVLGIATAINIATSATAASTLTFGAANSGNIIKIAGTTGGTINLTTDVTNGIANVLTSLIGTTNIADSGTINLGNSSSATTSVDIGGAITGNQLKISGTAAGTVTVTSDVTTGTVNLFNNVTTGTVNIGGAGASTINLGGSGSTVNAKTLTLTTDLEVQYGGTGQSSFTTNGVIYGQNTSGLAVTAASVPGSNATTSYGILTTDVSNVPVWTDTIDGGSY